MAAVRVALADDHALVRQALRRVLEAAGILVVAETSDGRQVADVTVEHRVDVLVLDMALPGLHGLDVLREVTRRSPKTRVLILTGDAREEFVVGAIRGGASGYLLKGSDLSELIAAITALAGGRRYMSSAVSDQVVEAIANPHAPALDPYDLLTTREREVLHLMAQGLSNRDIGERLFVSPRTVETHRSHILQKLNLKSQTQVVTFAIQRGLLPPMR